MESDRTEGKVECWPFLLIKISPRSFLKVECKSERVRWPLALYFKNLLGPSCKDLASQVGVQNLAMKQC